MESVRDGYIVCSLPSGMTGMVTQAELAYGDAFGTFATLDEARKRLHDLAEDEVQCMFELSSEECDRLVDDMMARGSVEWKDSQFAVRILRRPLHGVGSWEIVT